MTMQGTASPSGGAMGAGMDGAALVQLPLFSTVVSPLPVELSVRLPVDGDAAADHDPLGALLRVAPTLTPDERVWLGWQVWFGRQAEARLAMAPRLPRQARRALQRMAGIGQAAQQRMVLGNLRLVSACMRQFPLSGSTSDRMQDGVVGLIQAVRGFDPRRGVTFASYAVPWIRQAMQRGASRERAVRLPAYMREHWRIIDQALETCDSLETAAAQAAHIIAQRGTDSAQRRARRITSERLFWCIRAQAPRSLDAPLRDPDAGGLTLGATLLSSTPTVDETAERRVIAAQVRKLLEELPEQQRQALLLRFVADAPPDERAQRLGVTRHELRGLETRALTWLRQRAEALELRAALT